MTNIYPEQEIIGHGNAVTALAFSADGKTLVSGSYDRTVIVWDVATGTMRWLLPAKNYVNGLALTPDGSRLVVDDGQVWNIRTGQKVRGSSRIMAPLVCSPDGRMLAFASFMPNTEGASILVTDMRTGRTLRQFLCCEHQPESLAFSADGEFVAARGYDSREEEESPWITTVCNLRTGEARPVLHGRSVFLFGVNLGDGIRLVAVSPNGSQLWNAETGEPLKTVAKPVADHLEHDYCVCLSSNGQWLAVGTREGVVCVWDVATSERLWQTQAHQEAIRALAFTHDGATLATASEDHTVQLWDTRTGAHHRTLGRTRVSVEAVAFSPDGETITALSKDGTARLWRIDPPFCERQVHNFSDRLALEVPLKADTARNLWQLAGTVPSESELPEGVTSISGIAWTLYTAYSSHSYQQRGFSIRGVSPDGSLLLLYGRNGETAIWNNDSRTFQCSLPRTEQSGMAVPTFSPDNRFVTMASGDGTSICLFDTRTGEIWTDLASDESTMAKIRGNCEATEFAFSWDSRLLAVGHLGFAVTIWDVQTGKCTRILRVPMDSISALAFSPDAKILAIGTDYDETVWLRHLTRGRTSLSLVGHTSSIRSVDFSPDGTRLATGAEDGTVKLWEVETGNLLATFLPTSETE